MKVHGTGDNRLIINTHVIYHNYNIMNVNCILVHFNFPFAKLAMLSFELFKGVRNVV